MSLRSKLDSVRTVLETLTGHPRESLRAVRELSTDFRAAHFASTLPVVDGQIAKIRSTVRADIGNPLRDFFQARSVGRGIWKYDHYFDVYHRHLAQFVGTDAHLLEIG